MSIADNIKRLRTEYGLTQDELGKIANVTGKAVWTWEQGGKNPRMGAIQRMADYFGISKSDIIEANDAPAQSRAVRIKVYGSVPAGKPISAVEDFIDWEEIPVEWTAGGQEYIGLRVKGDSMEPEYRDGDTIIVRLQPDCESGQDAVVFVNGYDATFKKVIKRDTGIMLQPLNHIYDPQIYHYNDPDNPITILGIVVEFRRKKV